MTKRTALLAALALCPTALFPGQIAAQSPAVSDMLHRIFASRENAFGSSAASWSGLRPDRDAISDTSAISSRRSCTRSGSLALAIPATCSATLFAHIMSQHKRTPPEPR